MNDRIPTALFAAVLTLGLLVGLPARAPDPVNAAAAPGALETAKGAFLIDFTNPQKTAFHLEVIDGTHDGLVRQGVEPAHFSHPWSPDTGAVGAASAATAVAMRLKPHLQRPGRDRAATCCSEPLQAPGVA